MLCLHALRRRTLEACRSRSRSTALWRTSLKAFGGHVCETGGRAGGGAVSQVGCGHRTECAHRISNNRPQLKAAASRCSEIYQYDRPDGATASRHCLPGSAPRTTAPAGRRTF